MILGIDEVGRGPWAGPLVVGAVVLGGVTIDGLTDSKKLTKKRRQALDLIIQKEARGIGLGWVEASEIDEIGLSEALKLATIRAVEQITVPYHEIIIDGTVNFLKGTTKESFVTTMKKADLLVPSVSAASIVAKVARDNFMIEQDAMYPGYGFKNHVGYGTAVHMLALEKLGPTPLHRLSFAPVKRSISNISLTGPVAPFAPKNFFRSRKKQFLGAAPRDATHQINQKSNTPSTKQIGNVAEETATNHLVNLGHEILERNWKTKFCEIDIVSLKNGVIHFTEVKYRKNANQGGGLSAITAKKLRQMKFAAEFYTLKNKLNNTDMRLVAVSVADDPPVVVDYLEIT